MWERFELPRVLIFFYSSATVFPINSQFSQPVTGVPPSTIFPRYFVSYCVFFCSIENVNLQSIRSLYTSLSYRWNTILLAFLPFKLVDLCSYRAKWSQLYDVTRVMGQRVTTYGRKYKTQRKWKSLHSVDRRHTNDHCLSSTNFFDIRTLNMIIAMYMHLRVNAHTRVCCKN